MANVTISCATHFLSIWNVHFLYGHVERVATSAKSAEREFYVAAPSHAPVVDFWVNPRGWNEGCYWVFWVIAFLMNLVLIQKNWSKGNGRLLFCLVCSIFFKCVTNCGLEYTFIGNEWSMVIINSWHGEELSTTPEEGLMKKLKQCRNSPLVKGGSKC